MTEITTSALLNRIATDALEDPSSDRITIREFVDKLSERGFALAILLCTMPNWFPVNIPGVSTVFSVLIVIFTLQLMFGFRHMWMPGFIGKRSFDEKAFANGLHKTTPIIQKMERFVHPRGEHLTGRAGVFIAGLFILLQAGILALPLPMIPFSNAIPAYFIAIVALGLLERDGYIIWLGMIVGTVGTYFLAQFIIVVCLKMWEYVVPYLG